MWGVDCWPDGPDFFLPLGGLGTGAELPPEALLLFLACCFHSWAMLSISCLREYFRLRLILRADKSYSVSFIKRLRALAVAIISLSLRWWWKWNLRSKYSFPASRYSPFGGSRTWLSVQLCGAIHICSGLGAKREKSGGCCSSGKFGASSILFRSSEDWKVCRVLSSLRAHIKAEVKDWGPGFLVFWFSSQAPKNSKQRRGDRFCLHKAPASQQSKITKMSASVDLRLISALPQAILSRPWGSSPGLWEVFLLKRQSHAAVGCYNYLRSEPKFLAIRPAMAGIIYDKKSVLFVVLVYEAR